MADKNLKFYETSLLSMSFLLFLRSEGADILYTHFMTVAEEKAGCLHLSLSYLDTCLYDSKREAGGGKGAQRGGCTPLFTHLHAHLFLPIKHVPS